MLLRNFSLLFFIIFTFNVLAQISKRAICIDFIGSVDSGFVIKKCFLNDTNQFDFYKNAIQNQVVGFNFLNEDDFEEFQKLFRLFSLNKKVETNHEYYKIDIYNKTKITDSIAVLNSPFYNNLFLELFSVNKITDSVINHLGKLYSAETKRTENKIIGNFEFHPMEGGSVGKKYYLTIKDNSEYLLSGDNPFEFSYSGAGKWQASGDLLILDEINSRKKNPSDPLVFDPISSQLIFYRDGKKYIGTFMK